MRDNQRRCRARKLEYIAELERKLQEYQATEMQTNTETYQRIAERLTDENRKLRDLLSRAGVSKACIEAHLRETCGKICTPESPGDLSAADGQALSSMLENPFPNTRQAVS